MKNYDYVLIAIVLACALIMVALINGWVGYEWLALPGPIFVTPENPNFNPNLHPQTVFDLPVVPILIGLAVIIGYAAGQIVRPRS